MYLPYFVVHVLYCNYLIIEVHNANNTQRNVLEWLLVFTWVKSLTVIHDILALLSGLIHLVCALVYHLYCIVGQFVS